MHRPAAIHATGSARDRDGVEHAVDDGVGADAFQLGLGTASCLDGKVAAPGNFCPLVPRGKKGKKMKPQQATSRTTSQFNYEGMVFSGPDDTVIIGAGAAGLAAASELAAKGQHVLILEARERIGGRILTDRTIPIPVAIELGAEFVHGASSAVIKWLKRANQLAVDASRNRWRLNDGELHPANDGLEQLKRRFERLRPPRPDIPFSEFLERHRRALPQPVREMACMMVQGFDAADASRISTLEVLDEWSGGSAADAPTLRPVDGYDALMDSMRQALAPECAALRLGTVVHEIAWRKGRVTIEALRHGEPIRIQAARAVITMPLGVLQLPPASPGSVRFTPELRDKRSALAHRFSVWRTASRRTSFPPSCWSQLSRSECGLPLGLRRGWRSRS